MRVRDDDVFKLGGKYLSHEQAINRFKEVHKIIIDGGAVHVVALICGTLDQFSGGIEFLKEAYNKEELLPEIHGWQHVDYALYPFREIIYDLNRCIDLIQKNFEYTPTKFYTPWGANAPQIKLAAESLDLELIDCSNVLYPKKKFFTGKMWKEYSELVRSEKQELFIHWWQDRWFNVDSHSLIKTLKVIKENDISFFEGNNYGN